MTWPFENDTSAITKKLAQRSFKANKLRNIVAVIAIVLTSMLFTSVTTLCVGAIQSIQTTILQIRGTSPSTGTSVNWIAIIAALFFIMIFVITGYLLIRNIFEISVVQEIKKTSVYKGYKQDKIEMRGDRAEMSDFPLYLNTVAGGLDCRDQTIGGFSFVVKIYAVPVVEIIG